MGYLNRMSLNEYGQYFFSDENKKIINNEIQKVVFRYTEVQIGSQNLEMINDYMVQIYQVYGNFEYDTNEQLIAVCISSYERGTKMSRTPQQRVEMRINGVNLIFGARAADERLAELAEEGGGSYPFDECVQDQIKRYGSEETAKKVCGAIKRDYGS